MILEKILALSFTKNIMSRKPSRSRLVKEMVDAASQGRTETMLKLIGKGEVVP